MASVTYKCSPTLQASVFPCRHLPAPIVFPRCGFCPTGPLAQPHPRCPSHPKIIRDRCIRSAAPIRFEHGQCDHYCLTELVRCCFSASRKPQMWFEKWLSFVDIRGWQQELLLIETSIGCQWWWGRIRVLFYHSEHLRSPPPIFPPDLVIYASTQLTEDGHYFPTVFVNIGDFEIIQGFSLVLFSDSRNAQRGSWLLGLNIFSYRLKLFRLFNRLK